MLQCTIMIKIHPILREIIKNDLEAYVALVNGYMNMSSYAATVKPIVEAKTKKQVTVNSLVVSLSRLKNEFEKEKPLIHDVDILNITSKLPLSDIIYESTNASIAKLESLHKNISIAREDFFTATVGTSELSIVCSSGIADKIIKYFSIKPKLVSENLAAICISFGGKYSDVPNTLFSLFLVIARARINIEEIVSTHSELIFIIAEKDFGKAISLFSGAHKSLLESI